MRKPFRLSVMRANRRQPGLGWFWAVTSTEIGVIQTGIKPTRAKARNEARYSASCWFPDYRKEVRR